MVTNPLIGGQIESKSSDNVQFLAATLTSDDAVVVIRCSGIAIADSRFENCSPYPLLLYGAYKTEIALSYILIK